MSKSPTPDPSTKGKNDPKWWFQPTHRYAPYLYVGIVFAVVAAYYLITIAIVTWSANTGSTLNPGTFGDTFGAINALFTGVAFAGFLISLALQRQEMTYQKEQLELQRLDLQNQTEQLALQTTELEAQKEEMKRTREEMELQRNESNLFSLLDAHKRLIDSLTYSPQALNEEDRILGQAFFHRRPGVVTKIYHLSGAHLLKYAVIEAERLKEKRQKAFETKHIEHYSYLLGGARELARIFLIATGIVESDRLIVDFIHEKLGSKAAFYKRIYLNSLSQNERTLRNLLSWEVDFPDLPLLRLSLIGTRLGKQGHPTMDGFVVLEAHGEQVSLKLVSSFVDTSHKKPYHQIQNWEPARLEGERRVLLPAYPHLLVKDFVDKDLWRFASNDLIIISSRYSFSVTRDGYKSEFSISLSLGIFQQVAEGVEVRIEEVVDSGV